MNFSRINCTAIIKYFYAINYYIMSLSFRGEIRDIVSNDSSVIVASRNRIKSLKNLMESLRDIEPKPLELIIVDDASDNPIEETLDIDVDFRVKIFRNNSQMGPAKSRNIAVHRSRGSILLFTDDDCTVHKDWAGTLVEKIIDGNEWLGGVGGRVLAKGSDIFSRYYDFHNILNPQPYDNGHPEYIPYLITANCAVQKDVFMRAGGFDGNISIAGGEDVALSVRILKLGYHFERENNAIVWHSYKPGYRNLFNMFYRYGVGGRYVVDRYLPL